MYTYSKRLSASRTCVVRCLIVLIIIVFLPVISLLVRPRLRLSNQRMAPSFLLPVTSPFSDADCVVMATSPAHPGRVIAQKRMAAGRLGNDMFVYASLVGIAARNKMVPIYNCEALARTFHVTGTGNYVIEPPATNLVEESCFRYDTRFESLDKSSGDVRIIGFFQSWKYFQDVRPCIMKEFTFLPQYQSTAENFLRQTAVDYGLSANAVYIGVHIRRADMVNDHKYAVADVEYFRRAVRFMMLRFPVASHQLVFVVCSDDMPWSKENFPDAVSYAVDRHVTPSVHRNGNHDDVATQTTTTQATGTTTMVVQRATSLRLTPAVRGMYVHGIHDDVKERAARRTIVVFSEDHGTEEDLAILSACNHTIMTVGTFGWWAGYLAGGITVYYRSFPPEDSELHSLFSREDHFPPEWIGF